MLGEETFATLFINVGDEKELTHAEIELHPSVLPAPLDLSVSLGGGRPNAMFLCALM
jgi:hypothetical protein